nr:c myc promoter binding protein [Hymenolepis microstoma]
MNEMSSSSSSSEYIAECFAVCGLSDNPTPYDVSEILLNGEEIVLSESKCLDFSRYSTPIIDIQLVNVSQKEEPPKGYQVLDKSVGGILGCYLQNRSNDDLCICYRRGYDTPPIGDIRLVDMSTRLKSNSSSITRTIGNTSALIVKNRFILNSGMYLSYSRLSSDYGVDQLALTDICIILKKNGEVCPLGFLELPQKLFHTLMADDMHICYKKSFVKRNIATYQPEVLMWYQVPLPAAPLQSSSNFRDDVSSSNNEPIFNSVDIVNLSNFCLPWGAAIESWSVDQCPPETVFFTFVITNASYQKFHGSALTFYEPYDVSRLDRDRCYRLNVDPELVEMKEEEIFDPATGTVRKRAFAVVLPDTDIYTTEEAELIKKRQGVFATSRVGDQILGVTKTLCFVSRYNFGNDLKPLLEFLHSKCFGPKPQPIPLERYLAFMLCEIPFPDRRSPNVIVNLDNFHMSLQTPYKNYLSSSPGDSCALMLYQLGPEIILQLIAQLLTEQKLLFVSIMPDLLVEIIQQLITLIHPLRWVLVYIPLIHMRCIHVIQSPSPYLIGVDSRFFEFFQLPSAEPADISVVDLDTQLFRPAPTSVASGSVSCLPKGPMKRLRSSLTCLYGRLREISDKIQTESRVIGPKAKAKYSGQISSLGIHVRRACYHFMTELLQDYRDFLLPVTAKDKELLFDSKAFAKCASDRGSSAFYASLVGTQLWADFVRDLNCISERTAELEAFDTAIARLRTSRNKGSRSSHRVIQEGACGGSVGGETGSQVSSGSGGECSSAASVPVSNGIPPSPQNSFSAADGSSLSGHFCNDSASRIVQLPPQLLESDQLCSDLSRSLFTWTREGHFPELVNASLLDELCSRLLKTFPSGTFDKEEMEIFRLMADKQDNEEDFTPQQQFVQKPLPFLLGNGVVEALGLTQLNGLLKRTQQETTDSLIAATERKNIGGPAWAEHLLSEVYSLWFLLLPAFITSLQQHRQSVVDGDNNADGLCLEARHFLHHAVCLFLRLWDTSLQPVDQVYVRVMIALLYEYGTYDLGVINFWSKRSLNAPSYAMANQLQRDLGHKLISLAPAKDTIEAPVTPSSSEDPVNAPQALSGSDPCGKTATSQYREGHSFYIGDGEENPSYLSYEDATENSRRSALQRANKSSSDYNLSKSQWTESMDKLSIVGGGHSRRPSTGLTQEQEQSASTKKGWKSFAQASMRKLASLRVEYVNPEIITLDNSSSPPLNHPSPSHQPRSRSMSSTAAAVSRSFGYTSLFGHHSHQLDSTSGGGRGTSTRLPRNMLPWAISNHLSPSNNMSVNGTQSAAIPTVVNISFDNEGGSEKVVSTSSSSLAPSSWLQVLQRHLPTAPSTSHVTSPGPPVRIRQEGGFGGGTPVGSVGSIDESVVSSVAYNPVSFLDSLLGALSYKPPSWYKIAGSLAVGLVGDRICPANPHTMKPSTAASLRDSVTSLIRRRHRSRSSSLVVARRVRSNFKQSPSVSVPLLSLASEDSCQKHARSESPRSSKPPHFSLPNNNATIVRSSAASTAKVQELRVICTTCTPCGGCGRLLYDEEVMAEWVAAGVDTFTCTACQKTAVVPRLTVRTVAILEPISDSASPMSHGLIELSVPFLSPLVLRRQLEIILGRNADGMGAQAFSSSQLLSHRRGRVLLWNLVYLLHRVGLPTHLLDAYPAWLMDAQSEARRLGGTRRVLLGGSLTIARALSEVSLSPDLPVLLVVRWDSFPRKASTVPGSKDSPMLYRLWDNSHPSGHLSPSSSVADLASAENGEERRECALDEIVQLAGDCLKYENVGGALTAVRTNRRSNFSTLHSVHRELLLLYARIHGTSWQNLNKFDTAYISCLREEIENVGPEIFQQKEQIQKWQKDEEMPPSSTVLACRSGFRNLSLT